MLKTIAFAAAAALLSSAHCEAAALYVAATGTGGTCTYSSPCSTIGTAISIAAAGDTIICLTPPRSPTADGPVTITVSLTIDCSGVRGVDAGTASQQGEVSVPSNPITINVAANDPIRTVRIRGLTIDGGYWAGGGVRARNIGINIISAAAVHIEDCVISNNAQRGIYDHRTGGQTKLFVKDSVISGNVGAGIVAASSAIGITVLQNVKLENNAYGIATGSGNNVVINGSVISGNTTAGVEADAGAQVNVTNSTLSHNNIHVQAGGTIRLRDNDLAFSNVAIQGNAISMGSNRFSGNGSLGTPPSPASGAPADVFN